MEDLRYGIDPLLWPLSHKQLKIVLDYINDHAHDSTGECGNGRIQSSSFTGPSRIKGKGDPEVRLFGSLSLISEIILAEVISISMSQFFPILTWASECPSADKYWPMGFCFVGTKGRVLLQSGHSRRSSQDMESCASSRPNKYLLFGLT